VERPYRQPVVALSAPAPPAHRPSTNEDEPGDRRGPNRVESKGHGHPDDQGKNQNNADHGENPEHNDQGDNDQGSNDQGEDQGNNDDQGEDQGNNDDQGEDQGNNNDRARTDAVGERRRPFIVLDIASVGPRERRGA
jgi:hypothetical protein